MTGGLRDRTRPEPVSRMRWSTVAIASGLWFLRPTSLDVPSSARRNQRKDTEGRRKPLCSAQQGFFPGRILTVFAEENRVPICKRLCAQLHLRVAPREISQVPLCNEFTGARAAPAKVAEPEGDPLELPHAGLHFRTRRWTIRRVGWQFLYTNTTGSG